MADPLRRLLSLGAFLALSACTPGPRPDWRVDASRAVPWNPPAGRSSCPVDDTVSTNVSVWHLHQALDEVKSSRDRQVEVIAPGSLVVPEPLRVREVLRHDPCAASGSQRRRWIVLLDRGERILDTLELPWSDGIAAGPAERRAARERGEDDDFEDEWSVEGLDGSCLSAWAEERYGKALDRGIDSDSGLAQVLVPRSLLLRRSRAGAEVSVDLGRNALSKVARPGVCP